MSKAASAAARKRLTREERRQETRQTLLEAATRVFAEQGLHGATVDDVAEAAGFTKGAVYSHFGSKDEFFLAMLEQRYSDRMDELERSLEDFGDSTGQAKSASQEFEAYLRSDPDWQRLYLEAALHAARDGVFRAAFARRHREMNARLAGALERWFARHGLKSSIPYPRLAMMISAAAGGVAMELLLAPADETEGLLASMTGLLAVGAIDTA